MGNVLRLGIARVGLAINQWRINRRMLKKTIVILILGLQGAGKSTVALRIWKFKKTLPDPTYVQTKGFNTYEIRKNKLTIRLYDLGGHASVRELWTHYYADAHGIVYVVDSSKPDDLLEAGEILSEVLRDDRMQRKPVLVLANKQDETNAVSEINLTRSMDLVTTVNSVRCLTRVDICAANNLKMDQGIFNGFKWLQTYIEDHYNEINERVLHDSLVEQEKEKARFNLRRNELKRMREAEALETFNRNKAEEDEILKTQTKADDEEDGIDQVQRPGELMSIDGDRNAKVKKPDEEILERLSPEGAADSTEDLKHADIDNSNTNANENANQNDPKQLTNEHPSHTSTSTPVVQTINSSNDRLSNSSSRNRITPSNVIIPQINSNGVDNPAFEPNPEDSESIRLQRQHSNNSISKRFSASKLPIRNSAFSIRSNSTETDVDVPGEIILVTTKAEVHESQEMLDDSTSNLNPNYSYDNNDRNMSPTFSYISGHISHKTSQESIISGALLGSDSAQHSASNMKSRSRSSSASKINEADLILNNLSKTSPHPTPLQKLANLKSRNKTAPMSNDIEMANHVSNGNILPKKKDILH